MDLGTLIVIVIALVWGWSKYKDNEEKKEKEIKRQRDERLRQERIKEKAAPKPSGKICPAASCEKELTVQGLTDIAYKCPTHNWYRECRGTDCSRLAPSKFLPRNTKQQKRKASAIIHDTRCSVCRPVPIRKKEKDRIPKKLRADVLQRDKKTCQWCGRKAPEVKLHIDHKIPESKGGSTTLNNLQVLCEPCNLGKGNRYDN